ncbi:PAS domain-containing protein [Mucilaginibacter robiniae]|uniref:histidine kinase n=1 Tax=Mucilaginibacter robiniae TaxID=2728022 RepID=A0A7L5E550_9SPHI|nr:GAF domain-containing protein [Mucilaginibacter robiniae]QJD96884.1 PAS domain-containing protein [Mucilaginibacter robiniae]
MPQRELERLQAVNRFLKLEISKDKELQEIVRLAALVCGTPTALITLIDQDSQYIKFEVGFEHTTTTREEAFCKHLLYQKEVMIVPDTHQDERFWGNKLVTGSSNIRFYAGTPIITTDGYSLGGLCVIDQQPRNLTLAQQQTLQFLAKQVIQLLEFDASLGIMKAQFIKAKDAEIKLRSYFESTSACHLLLNKELDVLAFNKATSSFVWLTYHVKLSTGMNVKDYMYSEHIPDFIDNCQQALSGEAVKIEKCFAYAKEVIWWAITYEPARNPDGEIIGVSYNAIDITQRMVHESKVMQQNESLKQIAYIQSHEMRKPVASILGLVNLFKAENYQASQEELQVLEKAAEELDSKIKTIVNYTD